MIVIKVIPLDNHNQDLGAGYFGYFQSASENSIKKINEYNMNVVIILIGLRRGVYELKSARLLAETLPGDIRQRI